MKTREKVLLEPGSLWRGPGGEKCDRFRADTPASLHLFGLAPVNFQGRDKIIDGSGITD
jgi:hypothetical protein